MFTFVRHVGEGGSRQEPCCGFRGGCSEGALRAIDHRELWERAGYSEAVEVEHVYMSVSQLRLFFADDAYGFAAALGEKVSFSNSFFVLN